MGWMPGFARLSFGELPSAALGDRWVPWEVGDGSLRWTLEPPSGGRGRWGWRGAGAGQRAGSRPGLFLLGSAVVILLVGVLVGLLLAKVASHDAFGRADTHVDRWLLPTAPTT